MSRKMKSASTLPAAVEARSGHNGKLLNIDQFSDTKKTQGPSTSLGMTICSI
jgi:hypothetical protein